MEKENMKVFGLYSEYYDLLYHDKDYRSESHYVLSLLKKYLPDARKIADFGCGTGKHAIEFAADGYEVTGVEMSESMFSLALDNLGKSESKERVKLLCGDISVINTGEKYDAVFALFHVMGYLTSNDELIKGIRNIYAHLKRGGVFIFDYWYGPSVLGIRPEERRKVLEGKNVRIERLAFPEMKLNENVVEVNYQINASDLRNGENSVLVEKHRMRYFFLPELRFLLESNGFGILEFSEWMTGNELSESTWSGVCIAKSES